MLCNYESCSLSSAYRIHVQVHLKQNVHMRNIAKNLPEYSFIDKHVAGNYKNSLSKNSTITNLSNIIFYMVHLHTLRYYKTTQWNICYKMLEEKVEQLNRVNNCIATDVLIYPNAKPVIAETFDISRKTYLSYFHNHWHNHTFSLSFRNVCATFPYDRHVSQLPKKSKPRLREQTFSSARVRILFRISSIVSSHAKWTADRAPCNTHLEDAVQPP